MILAGWEVLRVKNYDEGFEMHFQDQGHSFIFHHYMD